MQGDCRTAGPEGTSDSHPALNPLLACLSSCHSPRQHRRSSAKKEAGRGCSSQRRASLAPPSGKGCCAANKAVSNAFWASSSITYSPSPPPTRSWNLHFEKCQPTPLPPGTMEMMHWKTASGEALPCAQFPSSPVLRHGETTGAALLTPPSWMSQICYVAFKSQLYQVLNHLSSPCPPSFLPPALWAKPRSRNLN